MKRDFWAPNIDTRGRLLRAAGGLALLAGAVLCWRWLGSATGAAVCGAGAAVALFQAARGWCVARACGLKTPH